jgi:hypothetical protein
MAQAVVFRPPDSVNGVRRTTTVTKCISEVVLDVFVHIFLMRHSFLGDIAPNESLSKSHYDFVAMLYGPFEGFYGDRGRPVSV